MTSSLQSTAKKARVQSDTEAGGVLVSVETRQDDLLASHERRRSAPCPLVQGHQSSDLDGANFGIPILNVVCILRKTKCYRLPGYPNYQLSNLPTSPSPMPLRGRNSLRCLFHLEVPRKQDTHCPAALGSSPPVCSKTSSRVRTSTRTAPSWSASRVVGRSETWLGSVLAVLYAKEQHSRARSEHLLPKQNLQSVTKLRPSCGLFRACSRGFGDDSL